MNKFFKYIENEYTINGFVDWIIEWILEPNWEFPKFIGDMPAKLTKVFQAKGKLYRCVIIKEGETVVSTPHCSWSEDYKIAEEFINDNIAVEYMIKDEENPIAYIYEYEGISISLNKIIDGLIMFVHNNGVEVEYFDLLMKTYDSYNFEKEHFAEFDLDKVKLIKEIKDLE